MTETQSKLSDAELLTLYHRGTQPYDIGRSFGERTDTIYGRLEALGVQTNASKAAAYKADALWGQPADDQRHRNWLRAKQAARRTMVTFGIKRVPREIATRVVPPPQRDWLYIASPSVNYIPESRVDRIQVIIQEVCRKHEVTLDEIKGPQRAKHIVRARHEACYALKIGTTLSLPRIGKFLGDRDHSTIMHSIRMHQQRMAAAAAGDVLEAAE